MKMIRKFTTIFLAVCMGLSALSVGVLADRAIPTPGKGAYLVTEEATIQEAYANTSEVPTVGKSVFTFGTDNYDYTAGNATWSPADSTFKAGVAYTVTFTMEIDYFDGVFDEDVKVYVSDPDGKHEATVISGAGTEKVTAKYTYPVLKANNEIDDIAINIEAPKAGEAPAKSASYTSADSKSLAIKYIFWYERESEEDSWTKMLSEDTFKAGYRYQVMIVVYPGTGRYFSGYPSTSGYSKYTGTYTVNGSKPSDEDKNETYAYGDSGTRYAQCLVAKYTFPALEGETEASTLKEAKANTSEVPTVGKPVFTFGTDNYDYTAGNTTWSPADTTFKAGVAYTVTFKMEIDYFDGVFDENVKVYVSDPNGKHEATVISGAGTKQVTAKYTYPALPADSDETDKDPVSPGSGSDDDSDSGSGTGGGKDSGSGTGSGSGSGTSKPTETYKFPFTDVADGAWYRQDVETAHKNGLINGKGGNTYCPNDNMTYAEAVKLACAMNQLHYNGKVTLANGGDVWYSTYMKYALEKGIIKNDLTAVANTNITRSDFVKIFYAALPQSEFKEINNVADNAIPDVSIGSDDAKEIYAFYRAGILVGSDSIGTFNPSSNIVRSEVAAILTRMFDDTARKTFELK